MIPTAIAPAFQLHDLRGCVSDAIIAFGRAVLFFLSLFVFALAARKRTTEKWGSTMLPFVLSVSKGRQSGV
jgi:hypothetical protein